MTLREIYDDLVKRIGHLEGEKASLQNRINELMYAADMLRTKLEENAASKVFEQ